MPAVSYSITKLESNFVTMYLLALIFLRMLVKMTLPTLKMCRAAWLGRRVDMRGPERGESLPSKASMAITTFSNIGPTVTGSPADSSICHTKRAHIAM